jgi:hypothetical protein
MISLWRSSNPNEARTILANKAITTDYDIALWVDSDNCFSPNDATRIVEQAHSSENVVGALYRSRAESLRYVCEPKDQLTHEGMQPAYWVGFGLTAMPMNAIRKVIERFDKEAFRTSDLKELGTVIPEHLDNRYADDIAFCRHWLMLGGSVYVDSFTRIGHIGPTIFSL